MKPGMLMICQLYAMQKAYMERTVEMLATIYATQKDMKPEPLSEFVKMIGNLSEEQYSSNLEMVLQRLSSDHPDLFLSNEDGERTEVRDIMKSIFLT